MSISLNVGHCQNRHTWLDRGPNLLHLVAILLRVVCCQGNPTAAQYSREADDSWDTQANNHVWCLQARLSLLSEQDLRLLLFYIVTIDPSAIVQLLRPISSLVGVPSGDAQYSLVRALSAAKSKY